MAETNRPLSSALSQPPPPPPLPPQRPSVLQRFIAPLAFARPQRQQDISTTQSNSASPKDISQDRPQSRAPARNAVHRTGIPISAVDINQDGTHAVLAGRDILRTVRVEDRAVHEILNVRNAVNNYISTQQLKSEEVRNSRDFLPAKDVRWSHGVYSHIVATAAHGGRIALYDVNTLSSRVQLSWLYQHDNQVNKLDFIPHEGYMLLSGSQDKYCKIWDIRDSRNPSGYKQYHIKAPVRDVRWSPTNSWEFALCTEGGVVQKWDVRNPAQYVTSINAHSKSCYTIAWHPDGRHLASGGTDKLLRIWDMKSELKGQKNVLQVRCPHGIMNLAWRPPAWSAEFAKRRTWQTCHIATSYTDDDPRVHVWDLRRPLLPFRELSNYETRPWDLLWANKDLLWTVGSSGIFAQSDMSYANQVEDSLPPGAVEWSSDGSFYAVVENRTVKRQPSTNEPSAIFLNVPQDKLSGVEDGSTSCSLTDDEAIDVSFAEHSRRQSRTAATRSKSQANTPPAHENQHKVLSLDRAVMGMEERFINGQVGALSRIPGIHLPISTVEFVASNYAQVMTAEERAAEPDKILNHLQTSFVHNANVCQVANMLDVASNWRLMAEVVVPELKSWADNNRKRRLEKEEEIRLMRELKIRKGSDRDTLSPLPRLTPQGKDGKSPSRSEKLTSNLFRGVAESHRGSSDSGIVGGSNMTTPRQHPLPNSPGPSRKDASVWFTLDDTIESMPPLPPSLINAHSTAAAASRALLDNIDEPSSPLTLSPGSSRVHRRSATEPVTPELGSKTVQDAPTRPTNLPPADRAQTLFINRNQENRRAALRDYKASARQPFSLEAPVASPQYGREIRHDSSESFPMFSVSGSSSAKARSLGRSFDTSDVLGSPQRPQEDPSDWFQQDGYSGLVPQSADGENAGISRAIRASLVSQTEDFMMDESPALPLILEGASDSKPVAVASSVTQQFKEVLGRSPRSKDEAKEQTARSGSGNKITTANSDGVSSSREGPVRGFLARDHHLTNPLLGIVQTEKLGRIDNHDLISTSGYHASDFRPIDIMKYQPYTTCFAISAYPVICEVVQFDVNQGSACSQFSSHLLSHVHPFFFHQSLRTSPTPDDISNLPQTLADRLLSPIYSSRIIENIFATHMDYLRRLNLYIPAAGLRKLAIRDFDYPHLAGPEARTETGPVGDQLKIDPLRLKSSCSTCKTLLATNSKNCKNCSSRVEDCPVCDLSMTAGPVDTDRISYSAEHGSSTTSSMTVYCHVCGHSAHQSCMSTWLNLPDTNGECPTPDCGCDCGPGLLRNQRIARQVEANEIAVSTRSSMPSAIKRDSKVVGSIPAVNKARDVLRKSSTGGFGEKVSGGVERGIGDEKNISSRAATSTPGSTSAAVWSRKGTSTGPGRGGPAGMGTSNGGNGGGGVASASAGVINGTSFGRRVRVVEPEK